MQKREDSLRPSAASTTSSKNERKEKNRWTETSGILQRVNGMLREKKRTYYDEAWFLGERRRAGPVSRLKVTHGRKGC